MGQDDTAINLMRSTDPLLFSHELGIGLVMKPISLDAELFIAFGDRKEASHPRHVTVKRGVEAGDLGKVGIAH